jgi:hypothetical protein
MNEFFKDILQWLRDRLSKPLARAVSIGTTVLGCIAVIDKEFEGFEWRDVIQSSYFLTGLTLFFFLMLVTLYRHKKVVSRRQRYTVSISLLLLAVFSAYMSYRAWSSYYNPIGLFADRRWHWTDSGGVSKWYWEIHSAIDKPTNLVIRIDVRCEGNEIENFWPIPIGDSSSIAKEVGFQKPLYREWSIQAFQRPAAFRFWLSLKTQTAHPDQCIHREIRLGG